MLLDALYGLLPILAAMTLATLPLAVVLPSSPPLDDATKRPPRPSRVGWRISITITRNE